MGKSKFSKVTIRVCPYCGNEIPYNSYHKVFKCKFCKSDINPEDNNIKEVIRNVKGK